jgi:hypothetical protein
MTYLYVALGIIYLCMGASIAAYCLRIERVFGPADCLVIIVLWLPLMILIPLGGGLLRLCGYREEATDAG